MFEYLVNVYLTLYGIVKLILKCMHHCTFWPAKYESWNCSTNSSSLSMVSLVNYIYFSMSLVELITVKLICISLKIMLNIFLCDYFFSMYLLGEVSTHIFSLFSTEMSLTTYYWVLRVIYSRCVFSGTSFQMFSLSL